MRPARQLPLSRPLRGAWWSEGLLEDPEVLCLGQEPIFLFLLRTRRSRLTTRAVSLSRLWESALETEKGAFLYWVLALRVCVRVRACVLVTSIL